MVCWWGAGLFGIVVGWVTYRALRRSKSNGISDIAAVIGAVGGATVTAHFQADTNAFGWYSIGLAIGFFGYLITAMLLTTSTRLDKVNEWLGERPPVSVDAGAQTGTDNPNDRQKLSSPAH
jgi:hypothetical protein